MKFHKDPNNPNEMICDDCYQALEDINSEWMDVDDSDYFNSFQGEYDEEEDEDQSDE